MVSCTCFLCSSHCFCSVSLLSVSPREFRYSKFLSSTPPWTTWPPWPPWTTWPPWITWPPWPPWHPWTPWGFKNFTPLGFKCPPLVPLGGLRDVYGVGVFFFWGLFNSWLTWCCFSSCFFNPARAKGGTFEIAFSISWIDEEGGRGMGREIYGLRFGLRLGLVGREEDRLEYGFGSVLSPGLGP